MGNYIIYLSDRNIYLSDRNIDIIIIFIFIFILIFIFIFICLSAIYNCPSAIYIYPSTSTPFRTIPHGPEPLFLPYSYHHKVVCTYHNDTPIDIACNVHTVTPTPPDVSKARIAKLSSLTAYHLGIKNFI